jgi:hypothetical protein
LKFYTSITEHFTIIGIASEPQLPIKLFSCEHFHTSVEPFETFRAVELEVEKSFMHDLICFSINTPQP